MSSTIILVHGAWLGGWCWDKVIPHLKQPGLTVVALDLPGHGNDQTTIERVSLGSYVERVVDNISNDGQRTVLVGHSMAGIVLSSVAEVMPSRISALVYVAAYLLRAGESIQQVSQLAQDSLVPQNLELAPDYSTAAVKRSGLKQVFCADADDADVARVQQLSRPEPLAPFASPVSISDGNFGSVPRAYIRTSQDRAITPLVQEQMLNNLPCRQVRTMNTSHTPFFAAPQELAKNIIELSAGLAAHA